jgi:spermidine/putrescine-binding protein
MKKIASLLVVFLMVLSVSGFAQKTHAYLDTKTARKEVDKQTVLVTFQLDNVSNDAAKQKFADAFKKEQGIKEVNATLAAGKATYTVKMIAGGTMETLQRMFTKAGIDGVNIDGHEMPTKDMVAYKNSKKKEQGSKK